MCMCEMLDPSYINDIEVCLKFGWNNFEQIIVHEFMFDLIDYQVLFIVGVYS